MSTIAQNPITILSWREFEKNTLLGFLDIRTQSGFVIHGLTVHSQNERRWVNMPARPYETDSGSTSWTPVVEIPDRKRRERFEEMVLEALDAHLAGGKA